MNPPKPERAVRSLTENGVADAVGSQTGLTGLKAKAKVASAACNSRRGFTMIEVAVVVALIGILAAVAVTSFRTMQANSALQSSARNLMAQIVRIRSTAASGRVSTAAPDAGTTNSAYRQTGLRVDSPTTISLFGDPDEDPTNGNREVIGIVDLARLYPQAQLEITVPDIGTATEAQRQFRFRRNGTLDGPTQISLRNTESDRTVNIEITLAGIPRLR